MNVYIYLHIQEDLSPLIQYLFANLNFHIHKQKLQNLDSYQ
jgi:hypothetical protein